MDKKTAKSKIAIAILSIATIAIIIIIHPPLIIRALSFFSFYYLIELATVQQKSHLFNLIIAAGLTLSLTLL